jgi:hypothetical protein
VKKVRERTPAQAKRATQRRRKEPRINPEEEKILLAATLYLMRHHGMFLLGTAARKVLVRGLPVWVITVTLRYTTGHEGYVGDLLYDGEQFTFLTEQAVMDERVRQIADDPERQRKWDAYRASTLQAGEG